MKKFLLFVLFIAILSGSAFAQNSFVLAGDINCTPNPIPYNSNVTVTVSVTNLGATDYYDFECSIQDAGGTNVALIDQGCSQYLDYGYSYQLTFISSTPITFPPGQYYIYVWSALSSCASCGANVNCYATIPEGNYSNPLAITVTNGACSGWYLSPWADNIPASGGSGSFTVNTTVGSGCQWIYSNNDSWVHLSATGTSEIDYTLDANPGPARTSYVKIYDYSVNLVATYTITQDAASTCSGWAATPTSEDFSSSGGSSSFNMSVTSGSGCSFSFIASDSWITPSPGAGNGEVDYTVDANTGSTRTGYIYVYDQDNNLVATVTVNQNGVSPCSGWAATPTSSDYTATGGTGYFQLSITSGSSCGYYAVSDDGWINNLSFPGNGEVDFNVDVNTGTSRTGTISVYDADNNLVVTFTVNQSGVSTCSGWGTNPSSDSYGSSGGTGAFTMYVTAGSGCASGPLSNDSWINSFTFPGGGEVDYNVDANPGSARTGTVSIYDQDDNLVATFTVNQDGSCSVPDAPSITGNAVICSGGGSTTLSVLNPCSGCTFYWSDFGMGTSHSVSQAGTYYCAAQNNCGLSTTSNPITVTIGGTAPAAPVVTPSGTVSICTGGSTTLSVSNPCSGCTIHWSDGGTGSTHNVGTAGSYYAYAVNNCGTSSHSNSVSVNMNGIAPSMPAVSPSGSVSFCSGSSTTLSVSNPCSGCTINWSDGGTGITHNVSTAGSFYAYAQNSCGTSGHSNTVTATIDAPPTPKISITGVSSTDVNLVATPNSGYSFQWFLNTLIIQGATTPILFHADSCGYYSVQIRDLASCSSLSDLLYCPLETVNSVEEINAVSSVSIYPNPGSGLFSITMKTIVAENVTYKVFNAIGQLVYAENVNNITGQYAKELNLSKNPSGVYFIKVETKDGSVTKKLVINK